MIRIVPVQGMVSLIQKPLDAYVISIRNTWDCEDYDIIDKYQKNCKGMLVIKFEDIIQEDYDNNHGIRVGVDSGRYKLPSIEHVRKAIEWAKDKEGDLIVHCTAGVSRSSAIALVVAISRGETPKVAVDKMLNKELHCPNEDIVRFGEQIIGVPIMEHLKDFL